MLLSITIALLCLGLFMVVMRARRGLKPGNRDRTNHDFDLAELLRLRQAGRITEEEYERARLAVLSRRDSEPVNPSKRGFEPLPPRKPMIQSLEDRISP